MTPKTPDPESSPLTPETRFTSVSSISGVPPSLDAGFQVPVFAPVYQPGSHNSLSQCNFRRSFACLARYTGGFLDTPQPSLFRGMYQRFYKLFFTNSYTIAQPLNGTLSSLTSRVENWRGGLGYGLLLFQGFPVCGAMSACHAPFPVPAHRTGQADFPHPALGQGGTLRHTSRSCPSNSSRSRATPPTAPGRIGLLGFRQCPGPLLLPALSLN